MITSHYAVIISDLRRHRDCLDQMINQLEAIQKHAAENSMVATNPAPNAAAPAGMNFRIMRIGDVPTYHSVFLPKE